MDFGKYNYAMVSFSGRSDIIMIGWGEDWNRARRNTNKEHFGKMTLARTLELVKCDDRFLIRQEPVFDNRSYSNEAGWEDICLAEGSGVKCRDSLDIVNNGEAICINGKTIERSKRGECRIKVIYDCGYYELFIDDGIICVSQETQ